MVDSLQIYLDDLWPKAQRKVIKFLGITKPKDLNLDVVPLFVLPKPAH